MLKVTTRRRYNNVVLYCCISRSPNNSFQIFGIMRPSSPTMETTVYSYMTSHYENMPMRYEAISKSGKNDIFRSLNVTFFLIFSSKHRLWVQVRTASTRQF